MDTETETKAALMIRIVKAGGKKIAVDTEQLSDAMFAMVVEAGLEVLLNTKMSKVPSSKNLEGKELADAQASAMAKAEENLEKLYAGTFKKGRAAVTDESGKKIDGKTMTEAMRLARNIVKDELRKAGTKISHVAASDITIAAKELVAADPSILEKAQANLAVRQATPAKIDIAALVKPSPKLVKAAEDRKAKAAAERAAKGPISATQAGKVKAQAKPSARV